MYLALKAAGVPAELHIFGAGGHGFGFQALRAPRIEMACFLRAVDAKSRAGWSKNSENRVMEDGWRRMESRAAQFKPCGL